MQRFLSPGIELELVPGIFLPGGREIVAMDLRLFW
jgi:hypothetical protein